MYQRYAQTPCTKRNEPQSLIRRFKLVTGSPPAYDWCLSASLVCTPASRRVPMARDSAHPTVQTPEDPLLLLSVLYGFWVANFVAFDGDALRELAMQFHALAEKQGATIPLMIGKRLMGTSLLFTGEIARGRGHYDQAIALYNPAEHRPLAMRFGQDVAVATLSFRSLALWLLGYPSPTQNAHSRMRARLAKPSR